MIPPKPPIQRIASSNLAQLHFGSRYAHHITNQMIPQNTGSSNEASSTGVIDLSSHQGFHKSLLATAFVAAQCIAGHSAKRSGNESDVAPENTLGKCQRISG